eukprot:CAMPEP_0194388448 /NCGR_PEP_ID=MMETSP0174-20130528/98612_1 /TAXON_ID=216777 /ORGANISM="Proboscia alata, Strain PI-D3" /LENGTH=128 /DNA_ID=CAMNT_0039179735 /DNA_START=60 /DNA_END=447 /DNA_ORIENTATION=+
MALKGKFAAQRFPISGLDESHGPQTDGTRIDLRYVKEQQRVAVAARYQLDRRTSTPRRGYLQPPTLPPQNVHHGTHVNPARAGAELMMHSPRVIVSGRDAFQIGFVPFVHALEIEKTQTLNKSLAKTM